MVSNTEKSGTRIFLQVAPSGPAGCRQVLKLVPGNITSSVHVVSLQSPQSRSPPVSPNTSYCINPNTTQSTDPSVQIQPPFSHCAPIKPSLPRPPLKSTETPLGATPPTQPRTRSKMLAIAAPISKNDQIIKPHAPAQVTLHPNPAQYPKVFMDLSNDRPNGSKTIRMFLKVHRSLQRPNSPIERPNVPIERPNGPVQRPNYPTQRPNSPIQRAAEDSRRSLNLSSESAIVSSVLNVVSEREQWNKTREVTQAIGDEAGPAEEPPGVSVVMLEDRIFFRSEEKKSEEAEVIDLCSDEVSNEEAPEVEDNVRSVSFTPAPAASRAEDRTRACMRTQCSGQSPAESQVCVVPSNDRPNASDTTRIFLKVPRSPQRPNSSIQSAAEDSRRLLNLPSESALVSEVLGVMPNREQWNKTRDVTRANGEEAGPAEEQARVSVVMLEDRIFFRSEGKESEEAEVINLCRDEVSNEETSEVEDNVKSVSFTRAPAASTEEDGTGTCMRTQCDNPSPAESQVYMVPLTNRPNASDTTRMFLKVPCSTQRPNSLIQRVEENSGLSLNLSSEPRVISPAIVSEILGIESDSEQWNKTCEVTQANIDETGSAGEQARVSVVILEDKIFFRSEAKESEEAEVIDLCRDKVSNEETPEVEDNVKFVSFTPAPAASREEDRTGTCIRTDPTPGGQHRTVLTPGGQHRTVPTPGGSGVTLTDSPHVTTSLREGLTQRSQTPQPQISSALLPAPCPMADHKLKQIFGITSELEIRLPRLVRCDTAVFQAPPLDYTEPIEDDFLCVAPPHSQDCPQVEESASRVGRTRKRTKCPCCSPAVLQRYHHRAQKRNKPGHARRRLELQSELSGSLTSLLATVQATPTPLTTPLTSPEPVTAPPRRKAKLLLTPGATPGTSAPVFSPSTEMPRKKAKLLPTSETTPTAGPVTTTPPRKKPKLKPPRETALQNQKQPPPLPTAAPVNGSQICSKPPQTDSLTTPETASGSTHSQTPMTDEESEEMQIHREIELLREALRAKEAALEKLKSDRNR